MTEQTATQRAMPATGGGPLCTERRIRDAIRYATSPDHAPGPYWVRDGRDGEGWPLYVRRAGAGRAGTRVELRQVSGRHSPARPARDAVLAACSAADPAAAYAVIAQAIEARGFTIA